MCVSEGGGRDVCVSEGGGRDVCVSEGGGGGEMCVRVRGGERCV